MLKRIVAAQYLGLAFGQALDWATTRQGLQLGAEEKNDIVSAIIARYGMDGLLALKMLFGCLIVGTIFRRKPTVVWIIVILHMAVSLNNLHAIEKLLSHSA